MNENPCKTYQGLVKDIRPWLNYWEVDETVALQNINTIKNIVSSKFKEKMWCEIFIG